MLPPARIYQDIIPLSNKHALNPLAPKKLYNCLKDGSIIMDNQPSYRMYACNFCSTHPYTNPSPPIFPLSPPHSQFLLSPLNQPLIYTSTAPAAAAVHHDPAVSPVVAVHLLQPLWVQRLDVGIVRLVDYCQVLPLAISHPSSIKTPPPLQNRGRARGESERTSNPA